MSEVQVCFHFLKHHSSTKCLVDVLCVTGYVSEIRAHKCKNLPGCVSAKGSEFQGISSKIWISVRAVSKIVRTLSIFSLLEISGSQNMIAVSFRITFAAASLLSFCKGWPKNNSELTHTQTHVCATIFVGSLHWPPFNCTALPKPFP